MILRNRCFQLTLCWLISVCFVSYALLAATINHNHLDISRISNASLNSVRELKIIFGHQSIGMNTIQGLFKLAAQDNRYRLTINEVSSAADFNYPKLGHFKISANRNPFGKISEFNNRIRNIYGDVVDAAFFKFCPFDINSNTDIHSLFNEYKRTMNSLKSAYPNIIFLHVTCPLVDSEDMANVKRNQFNSLLLREYNGRDYIFDIADIQSTYQNGARAQFSYKGTGDGVN